MTTENQIFLSSGASKHKKLELIKRIELSNQCWKSLEMIFNSKRRSLILVLKSDNEFVVQKRT